MKQRSVKRSKILLLLTGLAVAALAWSQSQPKSAKAPEDYQSSEQISDDLPVSFPVDI